MSEPLHKSQPWGAFHVDGVKLALPMSQLREVVPCRALLPMACSSPLILGALDLRGIHIPVLDLRRLFQLSTPASTDDCVVIVEHEQRLLGLTASSVDCLFNAHEQDLHPLDSSTGDKPVVVGSLLNAVSGQLVSALSAPQLLSIPHIPHARLGQTNRTGLHTDQTGDIHGAQRTSPLLLMRSQDLLFAVDPSGIETTMPKAEILSTDMARGHYRGNVLYRGREIPAIDLIAYLGLERPGVVNKRVGVQQAFVLRCTEGAVAVLIDHIMDIVRTNPAEQIPLPAVPLLQPHALSHAIAHSAIYPHEDSEAHFYIINPQGLVSDSSLEELSAVVFKAEQDKQRSEHTQQTHAGQGLAHAPGRRVIVFEMGDNFAAAIEEVSEVLSYRGVKEAFPANQAFRGILTHRQRAIPVLDLAQHLGLPRQTLSTGSNILIVPTEHGLLGLAVGKLHCIEEARWSPEVPVLGSERNGPDGEVRTSRQLVEVMLGHSSHMLELVNLNREAQRFGASLNSQAQSLPKARVAWNAEAQVSNESDSIAERI